MICKLANMKIKINAPVLIVYNTLTCRYCLMLTVTLPQLVMMQSILLVLTVDSYREEIQKM